MLTPDHQPAKNAVVYYFQFSDSSQTSGVPKRDPPTTRADEAGNFKFAQVEGHGELAASADGFGMGFVNHSGGGAPAEILLRPRTDVSLPLTVDGKPAAGVAISLQFLTFPQGSDGVAQFFSIPTDYRTPWSGVSDASGVCKIAGLPQGGQAQFVINDPRYAQLTFRDRVVLASAAQTQADPIQLLAASTISGTVAFASTHAGAGGVAVIAQSNEYGSSGAMTALDGTYSIPQLHAGTYVVSLRPGQDALRSATAAAVESVAVAAGQNKSGVNLSLIPGVTLTGSVVAANDGSPVAGVAIGIYGPAHPRDGGIVDSVTTDAAGHFSARVPPGEQLVYIMSDTPADGFGRPSPDNATLTIAADGTGTVEFRLARMLMSPVKGKVVDADGNPVAGATVFASSDQSAMFARTPFLTGADGMFSTMPMLRSGKIEIRARFHDQATPRAVVITHGGSDLVIQLQKNGLASIVGRVIDSQGKPLKGAQIELITQSPRFSFGETLGATDEKGAFKADALWADANYIIEASCSGYGESESSPLHLQPGQAMTPPDLTLYKRDSTVAGVMLDANSKPVAGQQVYVNGPRTGYNNLTTDSAGKFNCTVVSGDRLTVFYRAGRGFSRQAAKAGDQNIVLHSAPVRRAAPAPIRAAQPEAEAAASSAAPSIYNPADAVTWNAWLYAAVLVVVGGAIAVVANAIAGIRGRQQRVA